MNIHCLLIRLQTYDDSRDKILHFMSLKLLENERDKFNEINGQKAWGKIHTDEPLRTNRIWNGL